MDLLNNLKKIGNIFELPTKIKPHILFIDGYHWFGFDQDKVTDLLQRQGGQHIKINVAPFPQHDYADLPPRFYKKIDLDAITTYTVCNELEIMPGEIDVEVPAHLLSLKKWRYVAIEYVDQIYGTLQHQKIDKVVIPQGYVLEAAALRLVAVKLGVQLLSIENSFHKDKLLWDNVAGITVNRNLSKNFYWKFKDLVESEIAEIFVGDYLKSIKAHKTPEHTSPSKQLTRSSDKKLILFLGQVYVDSSVLFNLNDFASPERLICNLCQYCADNNYTLLVKLHPKEVTGNSMVHAPLQKLTLRKLQQLPDFKTYLDSSNVIIDADNEYDTYDLIQKADVCVTINSMSGLEACVMNRPVITCGYCSYSGLGFTSEANNKDELFFFLDQSLLSENRRMNFQQARIFFYIYLNLYCINRSEEALVAAIMRQ